MTGRRPPTVLPRHRAAAWVALALLVVVGLGMSSVPSPRTHLRLISPDAFPMRLIDIAPTAARLLGLAAPSVEGRVLSEILE